MIDYNGNLKTSILEKIDFFKQSLLSAFFYEASTAEICFGYLKKSENDWLCEGCMSQSNFQSSENADPYFLNTLREN